VFELLWLAVAVVLELAIMHKHDVDRSILHYHDCMIMLHNIYVSNVRLISQAQMEIHLSARC
jgi:hypothetical protein